MLTCCGIWCVGCNLEALSFFTYKMRIRTPPPEGIHDYEGVSTRGAHGGQAGDVRETTGLGGSWGGQGKANSTQAPSNPVGKGAQQCLVV